LALKISAGGPGYSARTIFFLGRASSSSSCNDACSPYPVRPGLAFQNKAVVYAILFRSAAETLATIAADPKHLGALPSSSSLASSGPPLVRAFQERHLPAL
jgi:hypothetical protein